VSTPARFVRRQSLRVRITAAFGVTAVLLAAVLSTATFFLVRSFLENQRVQSATDETVVVLQIARDFFATSSEPDQIVAQLQLRGDFEAMVTDADDFFRSTLALTPEAIPAELRAVVATEQLAYEFTTFERERQLVFGAPLPPPRTDLYLFYPLSDIDRTLSVVLRVLLAAAFATVAIAVTVAQRVARRVVRPVTEVSEAARRVAEGLLETRVAPATRDEVGALAASFNEMAQALEEMIRRERRFVANVSHELRTPIATLRTASELLDAHRDEFSPPRREAVELIVADVANLNRLVEELMEVSEVDAGRAILRWEDVDLRALAEAVVAKMHRDAQVRGDHVATVADKARMERVLANLIDNAYEHGGGRDVVVTVDRAGDSCTIEVRDAGPGIRPQDVPLLFDRFYKADDSRTRERGGIGLGLAIAYENVRLQGGEVTVSSAPGRGTTFLVRLPYRAEPPKDAEATE